MKTSSNSFISDRIEFLNNVRIATKLVRPFVEQLSLFDGCRFGTLEILWKYYRLITNSNQRHHRVIQSKLAAVQTTMCVPNGMQDTDVPLFDDPEFFCHLLVWSCRMRILKHSYPLLNQHIRTPLSTSILDSQLLEIILSRGNI